VWSFDGNHESPTCSPSFLTTLTYGDGRPQHRCHSFIRNGKIEYLSDCTHKLAGQTIDMVPWEDIDGVENQIPTRL
jgi:hypothetical protein